MWDEELVEKARELLSSEEMKEVEEVYKLVKMLADRINEVEEEDRREAVLYSTIIYLSEKVEIDTYKTIAILEVVKHILIKEFMEFKDWLRERLLGG